MNNNLTKKLTPRQSKAIEALLTAGDMSKAAAAAGISRETLYRWLRTDDTFRAAVDQATAEALEGLSRSLVGLGDQAVTALREVLADQDAAAGTRLRAADVVLGRLLQLRELIDLESRVKALEDSHIDKQ